MCSCTERFPFLFPSCTAPGAQLWFQPHFCVCATLRHLFSAQARGSKRSGRLGHTCSLRPGRGTVATLGYAQSVCGSREPQAVAANWGSLALVGVPFQSLWRQGLVCVWGGGPTPCVSLSTGTSFPRQTMLPLGVFLVLEPLTPVSSVLSEQPTWSLPQICSQPESFSTVYTSTDLFSSPEGFNTQPPPALANSHLRQGGPGLIPKKALGQVALRTPEPTQTEEALQAMPTREIKESRTSFLSLMKPSFQDYLVEKS